MRTETMLAVVMKAIRTVARLAPVVVKAAHDSKRQTGANALFGTLVQNRRSL
jgi:hypothetical protein